MHIAYLDKIKETALASNNPQVVDKVIELAGEFRTQDSKLYSRFPINDDWGTYLKALQDKRLSF